MRKNTNINIKEIRKDFPILKRKINGKDLIYFDNAATSQTPKVVIDSIVSYYSNYNSNIHRGVHALSQEATNAYEDSRVKFQKYFNADNSFEIIFTSGTTHSINLVANGFKKILKAGDEIIISQLVFVNHVSNALGIINPIKKIIDKAHEFNAIVLIDGAQATPHMKVDVLKLDVDFYVTSTHKICGPTGVGILYGKEKWLNKIPPFFGGGEMIDQVTFEKSTYAGLPNKFEAGTPNISGVIASGVGIDYMNSIGLENINKYEIELLDYATRKLLLIEDLKIYGVSKQKTSVISFNVGKIHPYDIGSIVDKFGIATRTGQLCAQPIMDYFKIPGTIRISFSFYNTKEEIDVFIEALHKAILMLS